MPSAYRRSRELREQLDRLLKLAQGRVVLAPRGEASADAVMSMRRPWPLSERLVLLRGAVHISGLKQSIGERQARRNRLGREPDGLRQEARRFLVLPQARCHEAAEVEPLEARVERPRSRVDCCGRVELLPCVQDHRELADARAVVRMGARIRQGTSNRLA